MERRALEEPGAAKCRTVRTVDREGMAVTVALAPLALAGMAGPRDWRGGRTSTDWLGPTRLPSLTGFRVVTPDTARSAATGPAMEAAAVEAVVEVAVVVAQPRRNVE